jgi:hypothetical protein
VPVHVSPKHSRSSPLSRPPPQNHWPIPSPHWRVKTRGVINRRRPVQWKVSVFDKLGSWLCSTLVWGHGRRDPMLVLAGVIGGALLERVAFATSHT